MHGDTLQLQHHRARQLVLRRDLASHEALDRRGVRPGMGDRRVTRDRLGPRCQRAPVALEQPRLHAAMLVAELDLEVQHVLAEAHEPERARLDHAGMDRADGDLVHLLPIDAIERIPAHRRLVLALEADRLEPRMAGDPHAELLVELALEAVERRQVGREFVVAVRRLDGRTRDDQLPAVLVHDREQHALAVATPVQRDRADAATRALEELRAPRPDLEHLDLRCGNRMREDRRHGPSSECATFVISALSCGGM